MAAAALACGCPARRGDDKRAGEVRVLTTFLPMYIFTANVAKGAPDVKVDVLLGFEMGCPHDYQLKPGDAKKIAESDALVANGGLEQFLGDSAKKINPNIKILVSNRAVDLLPDGEGGGSMNPHTWVSARNAIKQVDAIRDFLIELAPAHRKLFTENAARYNKELEAVWEEVRAKTAGFANKKIVTFHDAFDYFARDAGLEVAGYVEPTPGQAPSAGEAAALARRVKAARAAAVFSEPQYPAQVAGIIASEAGLPLVSLDPMSQSSLDNPPLDLYRIVMRKNLDTLVKTLGK